MRAVGWLVLASALVGAGSACSGPPSAPAVDLPTVRFHATFLQYRPDEGTNRLEVELRNLGKEPVHVRAVQITWAGVRGAPRTPKDTDYAPGQTIDLTTTYGTAVCDEAEPTERPRALVTLGDGRTLDLQIDRHGSAMLARFRDTDCARQRLQRAASVELGTAFRPARVHRESYLAGNLLLRRGPDDVPVTMTAMTGSVLLTLQPAPGHRLPSAVLEKSDTEKFPVLIGSTYRCDDHGVSQSTQTYLLSAYFRVDGGPQTREIVSPDGPVRSAAQRLMRAACR